LDNAGIVFEMFLAPQLFLLMFFGGVEPRTLARH